MVHFGKMTKTKEEERGRREGEGEGGLFELCLGDKKKKKKIER